MQTSTTGGRAKVARGNSGGGKPSGLPSKSGSFTNSFSQSQDLSQGGVGGATGASGGAGVGPKKHNVMITPGQRIRVRPSRKNKSSNPM
mmetsp:Transcript_12034/g.22256  ORF Transcript_12034/g.22256 Transcript_12034/m.22256 type:complete len:89 (-) Transcript_12034:1323-1589(-)